jgi:hypothetical protein
MNQETLLLALLEEIKAIRKIMESEMNKKSKIIRKGDMIR